MHSRRLGRCRACPPSGAPAPASPTNGATVWITWRAGRLKPPVIVATPSGSRKPSSAGERAGRPRGSSASARRPASSCPRRRMRSAHARRSCTPANVWTALSTQRWPGTQQPSSCGLAAVTTASAAMRVMSPRHMRRQPAGSSGDTSTSGESVEVTPSAQTPLTRASPPISARSSRSWRARNLGSAGHGSRVFSNARKISQSRVLSVARAGACVIVPERMARSASRVVTREKSSSCTSRSPIGAPASPWPPPGASPPAASRARAPAPAPEVPDAPAAPTCAPAPSRPFGSAGPMGPADLPEALLAIASLTRALPLACFCLYIMRFRARPTRLRVTFIQTIREPAAGPAAP